MPIFADIDPAVPDKIKITEAEWRNKELLNSINAHFKTEPGSPLGVWFISKTWQACLALKSTFKSDLKVGPALTEWMNELYSNKILPAYQMRTEITPEGWEDVLPEIGLYPHQKGDVAFLSTLERGMLLNGLGSGKSISSSAAVRYISEQGNDVFPVLIACPNSTKMGWKGEFLKAMPGVEIRVVDGSATQRRKQLEPGADVYIINWESLRFHSKLAPFGSKALKRCPECKGLDPNVKSTACEAHVKELNVLDFKTVIGDEIHRIMDPASKVSRAFKAATGNAEYRIGLSGTPIASNPSQLFSALNWLFPDAFPSKVKFITRFCITTENSWGGTEVLGIRPEMEQEFFNAIDPFMRRMPKELILPFLPPIVYERRDVQMGTKQAKAYNQMRDQMLSELDNGDILYTTSPLTKMTRLLQFSSSFATVEDIKAYNPKTGQVEDKQKVTLADPSATLDAFMDDLPDYGDESLVIFAVSSQLINMLSDRLNKKDIKHGLITGEQDAKTRQIHMDNFQAGRIKYILVTISAGGTGITLTRASTAVFLQRSWSMIENIQAEGRVHRIGSEVHDQIKIIDYVTTGSSQEVVFQAVAEKSEQLEYVLRDKDLMKKYILNEPLPEVKKEEND